jgi:hypothetical protein
MIELTDQQRREIEQAREHPATIMDRQTDTAYVLVPKDIYDRLVGLLYDEADVGDEELRLRLARAAAGSGWEEPGMEAYDRYDEELKKRCP